MTGHSRYRLTVWVAIADFFAAFSLVSLALYASHRSLTKPAEFWIQVDQDVKQLSEKLSSEMRSRGVAVQPSADGLSITLPEFVLFPSGEFRIADHSRIEPLAESLEAVRPYWRNNFVLVIQGHTDARPPKPNAMYRDNMELSRLRAREIELCLAELGVGPPRYQIVSQGLGPLMPIVANCENKDLATIDCVGTERYKDPDALVKNRRIELKFGVFSGNKSQLVRDRKGRP